MMAALSVLTRDCFGRFVRARREFVTGQRSLAALDIFTSTNERERRGKKRGELLIQRIAIILQ